MLVVIYFGARNSYRGYACVHCNMLLLIGYVAALTAPLRLFDVPLISKWVSFFSVLVSLELQLAFRFSKFQNVWFGDGFYFT